MTKCNRTIIFHQMRIHNFELFAFFLSRQIPNGMVRWVPVHQCITIWRQGSTQMPLLQAENAEKHSWPLQTQPANVVHHWTSHTEKATNNNIHRNKKRKSKTEGNWNKRKQIAFAFFHLPSTFCNAVHFNPLSLSLSIYMWKTLAMQLHLQNNVYAHEHTSAAATTTTIVPFFFKVDVRRLFSISSSVFSTTFFTQK